MLKLLVELTAVTCLAVGVGLISVPAAFIVVGGLGILACEARP